MKLGQRVRFTKHWIKGREGVDLDSFEEYDGPITINKLKPIEEAKEGIIAGKRRLGVTSELDFECDHPYMEDHIVNLDTKYKHFYLVACDFRGFHKVLIDDVEVIDE
jgi:hypothetical protein